MRDVTIVDQGLRELNDREISLHAEKPADVVERDARDQAIADLRRQRIELLTERNRLVAAEMVGKATKLRQQAAEIRSAMTSHAEALQRLEGISVAALPGRKSDNLDRQASQLEREARHTASAPPRAAGNVRGVCLEDLIEAAYSDVTIVPPSVDAIEQWARAIELRRFGQPAPQIGRQFHLIWRHGEVDVEQSSVTWMVARAEVA